MSFVKSTTTELNLLTNDELAGLPTNNLIRHLARFGKQAALAKFKNQRFKPKGIRNKCTLLIHGSFHAKAGKGFNKIVKLLNEMEKGWVADKKN